VPAGRAAVGHASGTGGRVPGRLRRRPPGGGLLGRRVAARGHRHRGVGARGGRCAIRGAGPPDAERGPGTLPARLGLSRDCRCSVQVRGGTSRWCGPRR
jgi:hypothetical protein